MREKKRHAHAVQARNVRTIGHYKLLLLPLRLGNRLLPSRGSVPARKSCGAEIPITIESKRIRRFGLKQVHARFHQRRSTLISVQLTLHLFLALRIRKRWRV